MPALLDLYCKAGGCSVGYHRAGFDRIVGVDREPQPNYPFHFIQADAVEFLASNAPERFDVIHASPPCQRYVYSGNANHDAHPDLLPITRELLVATGRPWVIENVPGAPMRADLVLCGSMFSGLAVRRHRWFESNLPLPPWPPAACDHSRPVAGVYGHPHGKHGAAKGMLPSTLESWSAAMGIDWMTTAELADAIPPAYAEFIGGLVLETLGVPDPE